MTLVVADEEEGGGHVMLSLALPLVASVLLGALGPAIARRSEGWVAVRLIPSTAVLVAASTVVSLTGFAVLVLARLTGIAAFAGLSAAALPTSFREVPLLAGVVAGLTVAAMAVAALYRGLSLTRDLVDSHRVAGLLPPAEHGVHLVVDDRPRAFAAAGLPGRVVVSTGLWSVLSEAERNAVLAHERAHLRRRHHLSLIAVRLAAAVDPLLLPIVAATRYAVEREADEDAAAAVGSRRVVGIAVARAGLAVAEDGRHPAARAERALAMGAGEVPRRVAALLAPPVRGARSGFALPVALALGASVAFVGNGMSTDHHIDRARAAYTAALRHRADSARPPIAHTASEGAGTPTRAGRPSV